ncbi:hypothetical protein DFH08DRAFT_823937 [Mycena albidolilacea]|uniref:Uncharacterized protein n=1 Tax=Mycena albidolilacea TaxID=1033008 RepID=A0AAD6Z4Z1_9AGAR|nr:hypothetical protein DFH08DRAFT_823937 [Mycena albidolilacea]
MSTKKPKTPAHPRSKKASLDKKARHTQAQADYRARNLEATREKAKLRMRRRRAQIKESEESSKEAAEQRREADAEYREMKRMRTYVDRHGLLALTNHYIPLKQQAGAKYMPGILAEGKKWAKTKEARAVEAEYKRRIKAAGPFDKSEMFFPSNNYKSTEDHDTHSSKSYWLVPDVGLFTSKTAANSQCGPDVEGQWKQHARRRHAEEEWASICARHHHHPGPTNEDDDEVVPDSEAENDGDDDNRGGVPVSRALTMAPAPRRRRRRNGTQLTPAHLAPAHSAPARSAPARSAPARSAPTRSTAARSPDSIIEDDDIVEIGVRQRSAAPIYLRFERHLVKSEEPPPTPPVKIEEAPFVMKQEDRKPKFKKQESMDPPLDPPSRRSARVPEVRKTPQRRLDPNDTDFYFLSDSPNTSLDTEASLDASPTRSPTEAAARVPAAAFSSRPMDAPSRAPSTTVRKHKARTRAAPPVATLITSSPAPASPRPPAPMSARAPTTVGATAPAPSLAHAPAPALAFESTASPARMAARELNSRAGVHLAPPAVLAPALELISAPDSNGRRTTRSSERPEPAREHTVPDSFSPVPRSTIDMPQPMRHRAPVTYATPARSICIRGSESPSRHNSKSPNPGPSRSRKRNASSSPDFTESVSGRRGVLSSASVSSTSSLSVSMFSRKSKESKRQKKSPSPERTSFPVFVNVQRKTLYKSLSMALEEMGQGESIQTVYGSEEAENILSGLAD